VDLAGVVIALRVAELLYSDFVSAAASPLTAYGLLFAAVMVLALLLSWQVQLSTAKLASPIDYGIAAGVGAVAGLAVAYALYHGLLVEYGDTYGPYADSMLRPYVHDLTWYYSVAHKIMTIR
jgi:hypothetical protein